MTNVMSLGVQMLYGGLHFGFLDVKEPICA